MTGRPHLPALTRRSFLRAGALAGGMALSGCSALGFGTRSVRVPPPLDNPPDAVYYPTHVEGMAMAGMETAGPYRVALTFSFPHRFWLVTGRNREPVEVDADDSVHLMATAWDPETGIAPPNSNLSAEIARGGEAVTRRSLWPMLSQNMGFHYGDNVSLPGEGSYDVTVQIDPMEGRRAGGFRDGFDEPASTTVALEFDRTQLDELPFETLSERAGRPGAVSPMEMVPVGRLPPAGELPGREIGEAESGDGVFAVRALDSPPGIEGPGGYLAVSARTPYNRYPLPFMALSGRIERGPDTVFDGPLAATLDPELGYHYGAAVGGVESGDSVHLSVGAPPQVARHEGYETAFLDMGPMELSVP